jgi:hypothetical protein
MMDKRFRPCNVSYVERLALQTKLSLAQRDSKVRCRHSLVRRRCCRALPAALSTALSAPAKRSDIDLSRPEIVYV